MIALLEKSLFTESSRHKVLSLVHGTLLLLGALIMFFPIYVMLISAFQNLNELYNYPAQLWPDNLTTKPLSYVWNKRNFDKYLFNSTLVCTIGTVAVVLTSVYVGYILAKFDFIFKKTILTCLLTMLVVPSATLLLAHYKIIVNTGLLNTYLAIIIPTLFSAFGILFMRQILQSFPDEYIEIARLDGVGEYRIFIDIVLPQLLAPCAALATIVFIQKWGQLLWPSLVASRAEMHTLPVALASLTGADENISLDNPFSAALVSALPLMLAFLWMEKKVIAAFKRIYVDK